MTLRCGPSPRVSCNKADAVIAACLDRKKMAIKMKVTTKKHFSCNFYRGYAYPGKQNKKMGITIFL